LTPHALADQHDIAGCVDVHDGCDVLGEGVQRDRHIAEFHCHALPGKFGHDLVPCPCVVEEAMNEDDGRAVDFRHAGDRALAGRR
jgi:hypothetical protein